MVETDLVELLGWIKKRDAWIQSSPDLIAKFKKAKSNGS